MGGPLDYMFGLLAEKAKKDHHRVELPPMDRWAHAGGFTANPTPPFRLPTDEVGPAPPTDGPLALMLRGKK